MRYLFISFIKCNFFITKPLGDRDWVVGDNNEIEWKFDGVENPGDKVELVLVSGEEIDLHPVVSLGTTVMKGMTLKVTNDLLRNLHRCFYLVSSKFLEYIALYWFDFFI